MFKVASLTIVILFSSWASKAQGLSERDITLMFYNVENLFDVRDDSLTRDEAFLPEGDRHWTYGRFRQKLNHIYKVVAGVGAWSPPAIIGFAEIENRYVLEALLRETPLHRFGYEIVHQESPDNRGIDVALLYRPDLFDVTDQQFVTVTLPNNRKTRDIMYVSGQIADKDTIHLYVNHWPSRYSGTKASEESRKEASGTLENHIRGILSEQPNAKVLVAGDFNDGPDEASMQQLSQQLPLKNISQYEFEGTHKHQGEWGVLDQWVVSKSWLNSSTGLSIIDNRAKVFHPAWLLESDEAHLGFKPLRTYVGFRYQGGFSDHLPIYIQLASQSNFSSSTE